MQHGFKKQAGNTRPRLLLLPLLPFLWLWRDEEEQSAHKEAQRPNSSTGSPLVSSQRHR